MDHWDESLIPGIYLALNPLSFESVGIYPGPVGRNSQFDFVFYLAVHSFTLVPDTSRLVPGKEVVMAKLIEFHVPATFQPPKPRLTPAELRGKIIDFPGHYPKSA